VIHTTRYWGQLVRNNIAATNISDTSAVEYVIFQHYGTPRAVIMYSVTLLQNSSIHLRNESIKTLHLLAVYNTHSVSQTAHYSK